MYQRKYYDQSALNQDHLEATQSYLARTDFVKSNKSKSLRKHGTREILARKEVWDQNDRKEHLRHECQRFHSEAGLVAIRAVEMQKRVINGEVVAVIDSNQMVCEAVFEEGDSVAGTYQ